ncbi:uncharacterized protein LOC128223474 [Mya arenaria]|uniref:uncharacterized protein LOC128223474 n=1 Tax=Mya arenaria TaxID=6604 RepID=UPI0022E2D770|nr:uncharacterized protein LOC128223474 [Mya arenaria]
MQAMEELGYFSPDGQSCSEIGQWVDSITGFSSEDAVAPLWGSIQVIGPPDVYPIYGNSELTWAPHKNSRDDDEYIQVMFAEPVLVTGVDVYETWNSGFTTRILAFDGQNWVTLWSTSTPVFIEEVRVHNPTLEVSGFLTREIKVHGDCRPSNSSIEIDAIQLRGYSASCGCVEISQWAQTLTDFSSEEPNTLWMASQVLGVSDAYPSSSESMGKAWKQTSSNLGNDEYIQMRYNNHVYVTGVDVYETYRPGSVKNIDAFDGSSWVTLWSNPTPIPTAETAQIFTPVLNTPYVYTNELRVRVDCQAGGVTDSVQLDAVQLRGYSCEQTCELLAQWVQSVADFSSEVSNVDWAATKVIGAPNVHPSYGDLSEAWAQSVKDENQYIQVIKLH